MTQIMNEEHNYNKLIYEILRIFIIIYIISQSLAIAIRGFYQIIPFAFPDFYFGLFSPVKNIFIQILELLNNAFDILELVGFIGIFTLYLLKIIKLNQKVNVLDEMNEDNVGVRGRNKWIPVVLSALVLVLTFMKIFDYVTRLINHYLIAQGYPSISIILGSFITWGMISILFAVFSIFFWRDGAIRIPVLFNSVTISSENEGQIQENKGNYKRTQAIRRLISVGFSFLVFFMLYVPIETAIVILFEIEGYTFGSPYMIVRSIFLWICLFLYILIVSIGIAMIINRSKPKSR